MYDSTIQIQDDFYEGFSKVRDSTLRAYYQYRQYYDRKAAALPLKKLSFCLLLNPKLVKLNYQMGKSLRKWLPLYIIFSTTSHNPVDNDFRTTTRVQTTSRNNEPLTAYSSNESFEGFIEQELDTE